MNTVPLANAYSQGGWAGTKYASGTRLYGAELSKAIRADLKAVYPECKFSVTKDSFAGGQSITIDLMGAPFAVFATPDEAVAVRYSHKGWGQTLEARVAHLMEHWHAVIARGYHQINPYYVTEDFYLTPKGLEVMNKVKDICNSYNMDDSDAMTDYFDRHFYSHINVGKWNKPFTTNN